MSSESCCVSANMPVMSPVSQVVIVDDNEDWRDLLAAILGLEGHAVACYSDGRAFLEQAAHQTPICVFLDNIMPDVSGLEVLRKLDEIGYQAPIFLITARADPAVVLEAMMSGAFGVIEKPFDPYTAVLRMRQAVDLWAHCAEHHVTPGAGLRHAIRDAQLSAEEWQMLVRIVGRLGDEDLSPHISRKGNARLRARVKEKFGVRTLGQLRSIVFDEIARAKRDMLFTRPSAPGVLEAGAPIRRFPLFDRRSGHAARGHLRELAGLDRRRPAGP
jgi:two-component system response regulator FixJ